MIASLKSSCQIVEIASSIGSRGLRCALLTAAGTNAFNAPKALRSFLPLDVTGKAPSQTNRAGINANGRDDRTCFRIALSVGQDTPDRATR